MGSSQSSLGNYAVPVSDSECEESSSVYRAASHPADLIRGMNIPEINLTSCWDVFQFGLNIKKDGPCIGSRTISSDGKLGSYEWKSYNEVEELAIHAGSALMNLECVPDLLFDDECVPSAKELKILGIYSRNREEWFILEQAANAFNVTIVPLYDTLGTEALHFVLGQTHLRTCVCQTSVIPILLQVSDGTELTTIVSMDPEVSPEAKEECERRGVRLIFWSDLLENGKENPREIAPGDCNSINTICYTSGTTGTPKGVLITNGNIVSVVSAIKRGPMSTEALQITPRDVHISYLPLAHVFERIVCQAVFIAGASIGLFNGDSQKLLNDIQALRPTIFISVPRLYNRINDKIVSTLEEKSYVAQYLFKVALDAKVYNLRKKGSATHSLWDPIMFSKTKSLMGGRLRYMIVGGAPLAAVVQERMSSLFCCPFIEGYGMTETLGASFFQHGSDPIKGSVGGVIGALEFKLMSLPELEYNVSDDPPRGELCVRGPGITPGYFRDPEKTKEAIDSDGWLHTGDVCTLLPNAAVKIIDRSKNMFKLAQGEYVAPEKIEQVYLQAPLISQIFCAGYSNQAALVAIIVPEHESSAKWAAANSLQETGLAELCTVEAFREAIQKQMMQAAANADLKGFEKVKHFTLTPDEFTIENNLLTPTMKLRRHQAMQRYESQIEEMYSGA